MNLHSFAGTVFCAAMMAGGSALAGTQATIATYQTPKPVQAAPMAIQSPRTVPAFLGTVKAGYTTKYASRGLAFQNSGSDNAVPVEVKGKYNFDNKNALIGGLKYIWMTDNGVHHDRSGVSDEGSMFIGGQRKWNNCLTTSLYYQFINGGIPGALNESRGRFSSGRIAFNHGRSEEHSFVFNALYCFDKSLKGWFVDSKTRYTFQWMEGWWFSNTLGYKWDMSASSALVVSGTWHATAGYFGNGSLNSNGTQGISLDIAAPFALPSAKRIMVTPFASLLWLGSGGIAANHRGATSVYPYRQATKVYRNFTPIFGVEMSYSF